MSTERIDKPFRNDSNVIQLGNGPQTGFFSNANLIDSLVTGSIAWTAGATLIDQVSLDIPGLTSWTIQSYSVNAYLAKSAVFPTATFGRAGKLLAALMSGGAFQGPTNFNLTQNPMMTLPLDLSTIVTLWDGSADPIPPTPLSNGFPALFPVVASQDLNTPIVVQPGDQLSVGLWLTPSLAANLTLVVYAASYSLVYERRP